MAGGSNLNLALKIEADIKQAQAALSGIQQQVGSVAGNAKSAGGAASGAAGGFNQLGAAAGGAADELGKVSQSASGIKGALGNATAALKGFVGAFVGIGAIKGFIALADEYGQMSSRIKMATRSAEEYEQVQMRLLDTANNTYRPLSEVQEAYIRTADALRSMSYNTHQAMDVSDSLSYLFVTNAASADRASSAIDAFGKSLQTGEVHAMQWQTLLAAVPSLVQDIATASGKSAEEIRKLGAEGKLSVAQLTEGLRQSAEKNKQLAADMPVTVADAFTKLRNSLEAFFGEVNSGTGLTQILVSALEGVGSAVDWLTENLETAAIHFEGWGEDIRRLPESVAFMVDGISNEMDGLLALIGSDSSDIRDFLMGAFREWPENVRQFIQIITVEIAAFVDKCRAFGVDIANFLNPVSAIKESFSVMNKAVKGELKTGDALVAEFERINGVRRDSLQAIADERVATEQNVEAKKKEIAAKREAMRAEIERQRQAKVNLKTPTSKTGGKAKADPVAQALAQQEQSLTVALAEAHQKLANAKNGVADAENRATSRLEIWLSTNKAAQGLTGSQIAGLRNQAAAVDAATKAYTDLAEAKARAERIKSGMEDINITLLESQGNNFAASKRRIEKQYRALVKDLNDSGDTVNLDIVTQVKDYEVAKARLDDVLAKIDAIQAAQSRGEQSLSTASETGLLTEVEGRERLLDIHRQTYAELQKIRPELEYLARQPDIVGQQAAVALQQLTDQEKKLQATTTLFASTLKNGLTSGLQQAISGLADGTMSLRDAIHALATEIAQSLLKMYADNAVQFFMKPDGPLGDFFKMGDSGAGGAGGLLGALFGNGTQGAAAATTTANTASVTANTAAITTLTAQLATSGLTDVAANVANDAVEGVSQAAETANNAALMTSATSLTAAGTMLLTSATALQAAAAAISASAAGGGMSALGSLGSGIVGSLFATGGYTGAGGKYQPAGIVHAGEFVARQEVVRQPGALSFLSAFNRNGMQAIEAWIGKGYADGGPVTPISIPYTRLSATNIQPVSVSGGNTSVDNKIALNLFDDPSRMADVISSPQGEKAFTVLLSRNPQKFRQILGV
ncbi:MAG: tape measure protein [Zoogloeaceae bacterium]|jgi:tape measure domain-containing protein|nr:tape measure protein [Zoogloeaceae bacterium]